MYRKPLLKFTLMIALMAIGLALPAWGHHILGVPHYAYDEEYPQTPVLTYAVNTEGYTIKLTGYPGHPEPGERSSLHVYIQSEATGEAFTGTVTLSVYEERFMRTGRLIYGPSEAELEEAIFKFYPTYDKEARYQLHIDFADEKDWSIILPITIGEPRSPWISVGFVGAMLGFLYVILRAVRIKAKRRNKLDERSETLAGAQAAHE